MSYTFNVPTKVLFGAGALKKLHEEKLPGKKALVVISNSGLPPKGPIAESGGLLALRRHVEAAGGRMKVQSAPVFRLTLTLA